MRDLARGQAGRHGLDQVLDEHGRLRPPMVLADDLAVDYGPATLQGNASITSPCEQPGLGHMTDNRLGLQSDRPHDRKVPVTVDSATSAAFAARILAAQNRLEALRT